MSLSYHVQSLEHTVDMTEPCSNWTHLLQVLQPLQLQLGLQENKKAEECNMLLFFHEQEEGEDRIVVLFANVQSSRQKL